MHIFKRQFTTKDAGFQKMRNTIAAQEYTLIHLRRYLSLHNMRMVYKILGVPLPNQIRQKLSAAGADFSDYFPP